MNNNESNWFEQLFLNEAKSALSATCNCSGGESGAVKHTVEIINGVLFVR